MFNRFVGNENLKVILRRLIATKRVPHSLIFAGIDGIGKREFALQIAKSFVCKNLKSNEACDECANCLRAVTFTFPKVEDSDHRKEFERVIFSNHSDIGTVIPYKNNILVDAIRNLESEANFQPFESSARFFIINSAEKLNALKSNAANALLKTLEEPSATSFIFLITSRPASLLPTIISRCQILRFAPIAANEIASYLAKNHAMQSDEANLRARLARGSIGRALSFDLKRYRSQRELALRVLESLVSGRNADALLRASEELNSAENKDHYLDSIETIETMIHDLILLKSGNQNIANADLNDELFSIARSANSERFPKWISEIESLRGKFLVNVNRKLATDSLFLTMAGS